ncbi:helix-turn-helix domain-containing protein [Streptomyces cacaoi]|uniref:Transcriptional regulator n=1 Tax=Streptomyces cacaoi TaxID=1898 RepID=A0A4Y3QTR8_STRCI|nr:helix-turn-helix transcriptional regulator [Streptomyces cacaoi]NNG89091.1 helix-turn-helix domain-containing protein [Streptomyces cacaoi]GEB48612.1 transcriptional regulator [Streptomyces cacaoi]
MPSRPNCKKRKPTALGLLTRKLAELRKAKGLSYAQLALKIGYDRADLHKLEQGTKLCSEYVIGKLDALYGTGDQLSMLLALAKEEGIRERYRAYISLEEGAIVLHEYASAVMPGLLQTEAYADTVLRTAPHWDPDELEQQLKRRIARQGRVTGEGPAVHYRTVLDEACFARRPSPEVWHEQLVHLEQVARLWNVTVQLLPFTAGLHDLTGGNLMLLWQPDGTNLAYQESSHTASWVDAPNEVAELRLSYDPLRDASLSPRESLAYIQRALEETTHAHRAENHELA